VVDLRPAGPRTHARRPKRACPLGQGPGDRASSATLRRPDPVARQLLRLLDDPPVHEGEPEDLDTLDQDEFAAQGIVGVPEAQVVSAASATDDEREATQRQLDYWMGTVCRPWSLRWLDVERSRSFYKQLFDPRTRADRDRDVSERVWVSAVLGGNPILTAERQLSSTTRSCSCPSSSLS
jgi:hypothetical protein